MQVMNGPQYWQEPLHGGMGLASIDTVVAALQNEVLEMVCRPAQIQPRRLVMHEGPDYCSDVLSYSGTSYSGHGLNMLP